METQIVYADPSQLLADSNVRFGLKKFKVEHLAEDILASGGIQVPLNVEALEEPGPNGEVYRIREGHYRHAAAAKLMKDGVDCQCPIIIVDPLDPAARIERQIAENMEREDFSPMDIAVSAQKLLDEGKTKVEVRQRYVRPGGRKGTEMKPISNSILNIYLSFLDFPKKIQNLIHVGVIGVVDAMNLRKKPESEWDAIIERAEADRDKDPTIPGSAAEKSLEAKYEAEQKKIEEADARTNQEKEALEKAKADAEAKRKAAEEVSAKLSEALQAKLKAKGEEKKKADDAFKALENDVKVKSKIADDADKDVEKLQVVADKTATRAEELKRKLSEARQKAASTAANAAPEKGKLSVGKVMTNGSVVLNAKQMRDIVEKGCLPAGGFPKTQQIFKALRNCFNGVTTDNQMFSEVAWLVGERKEKPKHVKVDKPTATAVAAE